MNELLKRGHEGVGSDIQENYSGVADGSAVTKAPYVALDITDKEAVEKVITEVKAIILHIKKLLDKWKKKRGAESSLLRSLCQSCHIIVVSRNLLDGF